jgi:hypothetical protein
LRRSVAAVLVLVVLAVPGCKKEEDKKNEVKRAIERTMRLSHDFAYLDQEGGNRIQVVGVVEDDFRHKARVVLNGAPVLDEVASDDALAIRFLDPEALGAFVDQAAATTAASAPALPTGGAPGVSVLDALRTRRWVLDPIGAPDLQGTAGDTRYAGEDPVFVALTASV